MANNLLNGVYVPTWFDPKNRNVTKTIGNCVFADLTSCDLWIQNNTIHPEQYKSIYTPIKY